MSSNPQFSTLEIFHNLNGGRFSQREVNTLVETCFKIATSYLHSIHRRISKILKNSNLSIQDTAIDAVADLFKSDSETNELVIRKSFNNWQPAITTEDDALFFLNRVVAKKTEQYITSLLKYSDPLFDYILTKVLYQLKKYNYSKIRYLGCVYIVENNQNKIEGKVISPDELQRYSSVLLKESKNYIHPYLVAIIEEEYYPALPLNALVYNIKNIHFSSRDFPADSMNMSSHFELEELVNLGLNLTIQKLNDTYVLRGKLNRDAANIFEMTLRDIARDLKEGGLGYELYEYLRNNLPELSKTEYETKYQNIIAYLYKTLRDAIADNILREK